MTAAEHRDEHGQDVQKLEERERHVKTSGSGVLDRKAAAGS